MNLDINYHDAASDGIAMTSAPKGNLNTPVYSRLQVALHWVVILLVIEQWYTSQAIARTHNPFLRPSDTDLVLHAMHNYAGVLLGTLMAVRIGLRWDQRRLIQTDSPGLQERLSHAVHWALYVSLFGQAVAGFAAAYLWSSAGRVHILLWNVTLVLVSLHIVAAAYHAVRRDGVVSRMITWRR